MTRPTPLRGRGEGAASCTSGAGCFFASGGNVVVPSPPPSRRGVSLSSLCAFMINAGHANDPGVPAPLCVGLAGSLAGDGRNAKHQGLRHRWYAVACSIIAAFSCGKGRRQPHRNIIQYQRVLRCWGPIRLPADTMRGAPAGSPGSVAMPRRSPLVTVRFGLGLAETIRATSSVFASLQGICRRITS
jgi:hypothetical protein